MAENVKFVMKCGSPFSLPAPNNKLKLTYSYPPTGQNLGGSAIETPQVYGGYTFSLNKAPHVLRVDFRVSMQSLKQSYFPMPFCTRNSTI